MTQLRVKYLQHPYATEAEWITRNPLLKNGEEGYALVTVNSLDHIRKKVGPGLWNDLEYFDGVVWTDSTSVSNPIGDAADDISGLTPIEILDKILNPYQAPVISGVTNDGGTGIFVGTKVIEIGNSVVNSVVVRYSVSNQSNLVGANPITVTANGRFTNEGTFPVGDVALSHTGFNPINLDSITMSIQAAHQKGNSNVATTKLDFNPKIIHAVSQVKTVTGVSIMQLPNKQYNITRDYTRDYSFGSAGYSVLCIPVMLNPTNLTFTDVTDPNAPSGYAMDDAGIMSINNGVATYNYQVYVSTYYLLTSGILRVS